MRKACPFPHTALCLYLNVISQIHSLLHTSKYIRRFVIRPRELQPVLSSYRMLLMNHTGVGNLGSIERLIQLCLEAHDCSFAIITTSVYEAHI